MAITLFLVVLTVFKGFSIEENPAFILMESILNFLIILDFVCRLKLVGLRRFFFGASSTSNGPNTGIFLNGDTRSKIRLWNWLDALVVICSFALFLAIAIQVSASSSSKLEEVGEIILLVIWALFQTLRVIFIARRQRLAQQSAKTLIDFTHNIIVVDSEAHHDETNNTDRQASRPSAVSKSGTDEVIVFDMKYHDGR